MTSFREMPLSSGLRRGEGPFGDVGSGGLPADAKGTPDIIEGACDQGGVFRT